MEFNRICGVAKVVRFEKDDRFVQYEIEDGTTIGLMLREDGSCGEVTRADIEEAERALPSYGWKRV